MDDIWTKIDLWKWNQTTHSISIIINQGTYQFKYQNGFYTKLLKGNVGTSCSSKCLQNKQT